MPRLKPKSKRAPGGPLDHARNIAEMEHLAQMASLEELTSTLDRLTSGELKPGAPLRAFIIRHWIGAELRERFKTWCRAFPEDITDEALEQAARDHRLPEGLSPQRHYEGVTGRRIRRNAAQQATFDAARIAAGAASIKRRYDSLTQAFRARLHDREAWPTIARMRPELAEELAGAERKAFNETLHDGTEVRAALSIVPRESK